MPYAKAIIDYAHKIGKNTADFTVNDLVSFMKEWMKVPTKEDIKKMTPAQRKEYEQDVANMKKWREQEKMAKNKKAEETNGEYEIVSEEVEANADEIVCSMELTKADVEALLFSITRTMEDYQMEEEHPYTVSLNQLKEGLEGVE